MYQISISISDILELLIVLTIYHLVIKGIFGVILKYILQDTKMGKEVSNNVKKSLKERISEEQAK